MVDLVTANSKVLTELTRIFKTLVDSSWRGCKWNALLQKSKTLTSGWMSKAKYNSIWYSISFFYGSEACGWAETFL